MVNSTILFHQKYTTLENSCFVTGCNREFNLSIPNTIFSALSTQVKQVKQVKQEVF